MIVQENKFKESLVDLVKSMTSHLMNFEFDGVIANQLYKLAKLIQPLKSKTKNEKMIIKLFLNKE